MLLLCAEGFYISGELARTIAGLQADTRRLCQPVWVANGVDWVEQEWGIGCMGCRIELKFNREEHVLVCHSLNNILNILSR